MNVEIYRKLLVGRKIKKGNFTYDFYGVEPLEGDTDTPIIQVNVVCKPNQSYVQKKLLWDITEIIQHYSQLISEYPAMSVEYYLNFQEPLSVYINNEDLERVLKIVNQNLSQYIWNPKTPNETLCVFEFSPNKKFYEYFEPDLGFNFWIDVTDMYSQGRRLDNSDNYNIISEDLTNTLNEDDSFRQSIDYALYDALEPELQIGNCEDVYYTSYFDIRSINGEPVKPTFFRN